AFSDAFNLFSKDPDGDIKLLSLEVTAKQLGISLTSQEAYNELVCADAMVSDFSDFLDIITDKKCFAQTICNFDSVDARGILLFKVFLKLVELATLPQRTLFQIISHYQQKLRDCTGQKVWMDGDFLKCPQIWKETVYPMPSFVSPAHISAMNKREAAAYVEHLKGNTRTLSLPLCTHLPMDVYSKQDMMTLTKPKKGLQKVARQRNEPTTLFESHFFRERNQVQEVTQGKLGLCNSINRGVGTSLKTRALFNQTAALKPPAHHRKQRRSPDVQAGKRHRHSLALDQHCSLPKLWQKTGWGQINLQSGSEHFHRAFHTYSWS
ncbi:EFCB3 protein, partial [Anhinga rufa]|nr:EFCB3 protein [Anhinga rufa]